ncbi:hypothetical protein ALC56_12080, partial [Trachymyrmex septentrionalis]
YNRPSFFVLIKKVDSRKEEKPPSNLEVFRKLSNLERKTAPKYKVMIYHSRNTWKLSFDTYIFRRGVIEEVPTYIKMEKIIEEANQYDNGKLSRCSG